MSEVPAVIYARATEEGMGDLAAQVLECRGEAAQRGFLVVGTYTDVTLGYFAAGPALRRLIDATANGTFNFVLCASLDRLSRQNDSVENIKTVLASNGVTLVACEPDKATLVTIRTAAAIVDPMNTRAIPFPPSKKQ